MWGVFNDQKTNKVREENFEKRSHKCIYTVFFLIRKALNIFVFN